MGWGFPRALGRLEFGSLLDFGFVDVVSVD